MTTSITDIVHVRDQEAIENLALIFPKYTDGYVQVGPSKYLFPVKYRKHASEFRDFKLRPDDVWVVTFPRSGTTVMQELVWLLVNDLDYEHAAGVSLKTRSRFLEHGILFSEAEERKMLEMAAGDKEKVEDVLRLCGSRVPLLDNDKSPRVIKTHLPLSLLPPKLLDTCKVVYVARNPRSVATSCYYFYKDHLRTGFQGDFPFLWNQFTQGNIIYGPHWAHIAEAWQHRNHPNLHLLSYENLITDMHGSIQRIAALVGKQVDRHEIEKLREHLNIENFRKNKSIQDDNQEKDNRKTFIRKGKNNDWESHFTPEMKSDSEHWIADTIRYRIFN